MAGPTSALILGMPAKRASRRLGAAGGTPKIRAANFWGPRSCFETRTIARRRRAWTRFRCAPQHEADHEPAVLHMPRRYMWMRTRAAAENVDGADRTLAPESRHNVVFPSLSRHFVRRT